MLVPTLAGKLGTRRWLETRVPAELNVLEPGGLDLEGWEHYHSGRRYLEDTHTRGTADMDSSMAARLDAVGRYVASRTLSTTDLSYPGNSLPCPAVPQGKKEHWE